MRLVRFPWKLANRTNGGQIVPSLILPNSPALLTLLILTAQDSPFPHPPYDQDIPPIYFNQ